MPTAGEFSDMTDRVRTPYSFTGAHAPLAARRTLRLCLLRLCLPALVCAALLCLTPPATAGYIQAGVPKFFASDPIGLAEQGFSVAVSADGNTALVGGPSDNGGIGAAWVFKRSGGGWSELQKLTATNATACSPTDTSICTQFGWSVGLSADGTTAIVGGPGDNGSAGAAWVFRFNGTTWTQQTKLVGILNVGSAEQGYSVALAGDGNTAIVGGWADSGALGAAWVYRFSNGSWFQNAKLVGTGNVGTTNVMQGFSVALSDDGNTAIVGGPGDNGSVGAAWVFTRSDSGWSAGTKMVGTTTGVCDQPMQGFAVALDRTGATAIVGGPNDQTTNSDASAAADLGGCPATVTSTTSTGAAWVWTLSGGNGSPSGGTKLSTSDSVNRNPGQGFSVALGGDGHTALLGGPTNNANTGGVWVFTYSSSQWTQGATLLGTGAVGPAGQASAVALSRDGTTAIIGGALDNTQTGAAWAFVTQSAALAVSLTGSGSVTSSPPGISCNPTCSANFGNSTNVSLTATPPSGWAFSSWSGACTGNVGSCTLTMAAVESVTATFVPLYTLTVSDNGNGTITNSQFSIDCQSSCGSGIPSGSQVTLTATPQGDYLFTGWSGACSGTGSCVVTMSMPESVTAMFAPGRTFVSGEGDDVNPCSRVAPCKTFAAAIANTTTNGEIDCLDPGGFGTLTITQSITIDCHEVTGSTENSGANGIAIAFDSFSGSDVRKTVNLRNLMISGMATGLAGIAITGSSGGTFVNIEDSLINGNYAGTATGILDGRTRGGMTVTNTTVRNMGAAGISITGSTSGSLRAVITETRVYNSNNGIVIGTNANVMLSRSVVSDNIGTGLTVGTSGLMAADSSVIAHNSIGFQVSAGGNLRLSNSDVFLNSTGSTGTINTFANNRFSNNGTFGTVTPIGSASNPAGLQ
jgi:List-Bact-rpt repeat protein